MVHWSWIVFGIVVAVLAFKTWSTSREPGGDYSINVESPFYGLLLIIFILVWGGIFWW